MSLSPPDFGPKPELILPSFISKEEAELIRRGILPHGFKLIGNMLAKTTDEGLKCVGVGGILAGMRTALREKILDRLRPTIH
jgi:hypothetical protein